MSLLLRISVLFLVCLVSSLHSARAQQAAQGASLPDEVAAVRDKYVAMVAELEGTHDNRIRALRAEYVDALLKAEAALSKKGAEGPLSELRKEKERFARSRHWRLEQKDRIPATLQTVFDGFKKKATDMQTKRAAARKRLDDYCRAHLQKHKRALTQQNRIAEAMAVKAVQDMIDGYTPPDTDRPHLAEGQEPKPFKTAGELDKYLAGTRWALRWRGGRLPARHRETLSFHVGRVLRIIDDDGSVEKTAYGVRDDLSVRVGGKYEKTIAFDPSFTVFNFDDPRRQRYRRGFLAEKAKPAAAGDTWKNLVLYYPLDEVSETVKDKGPLGRHGKATMTAVVFYGRKENAYQFNGRSSMIRVDGALNVDACDALSVSVWIKLPGNVRDATIFRWPDTAQYGGTYMAVYKGRFRYRFGSGKSETGRELSATYTPDTWHHVAMVHERVGANAVYLDGKMIDSRPALPLRGNSDQLIIGCRADGKPLDRPFVGLIDELMVFKRVLSPSEVEMLSRGVRPPEARNPGPSAETE